MALGKTLVNGSRTVRAIQWDGTLPSAQALLPEIRQHGVLASAKQRLVVLSRNPDGSPNQTEMRTTLGLQFGQTIRNVGSGDWAASENGRPLIIAGSDVGEGKTWTEQAP